jgi:hypothetical protein
VFPELYVTFTLMYPSAAVIGVEPAERQQVSSSACIFAQVQPPEGVDNVPVAVYATLVVLSVASTSPLLEVVISILAVAEPPPPVK